MAEKSDSAVPGMDQDAFAVAVNALANTMYSYYNKLRQVGFKHDDAIAMSIAFQAEIIKQGMGK